MTPEDHAERLRQRYLCPDVAKRPALIEVATEEIRAAVEAEREACAKIARGRESPWSEAHPEKAYIDRLRRIILEASLSAWDRSDDNEPEHTIARAVYGLLRTGLDSIDKLFGSQTIAATIRARSTPSDPGPGEDG